MTPRFKSLLASALLIGTAGANVASADTISFTSSDADKNGNPMHLSLLGVFYTLEGAGLFAYDSDTGLASYMAIVSNGSAGFQIELNLMQAPHAPRCYQGDCNGDYYVDNGIDPANDWTFFAVDTANTNQLTGFGDLAGTVLTVLGDHFFQYGDGAGGWQVTPQGLAFSGWFGLNDASGNFVGDGDINGNLSAVPVPGALLLFGSALFGFAGIARRKARQVPA